jgi:hypothetical protein
MFSVYLPSRILIEFELDVFQNQEFPSKYYYFDFESTGTPFKFEDLITVRLI